jgi:hypothetical protein
MDCDFTVDDPEPLLTSSRFLDMDEQYFAPTSRPLESTSAANSGSGWLPSSTQALKMGVPISGGRSSKSNSNSELNAATNASQPISSASLRSTSTSLLSRATERLLMQGVSLATGVIGSGVGMVMGNAAGGNKEKQGPNSSATSTPQGDASSGGAGQTGALSVPTSSSRTGINIPTGSLPPHMRSAQYYYQHTHQQQQPASKQHSSSLGSSPSSDVQRFRIGSLTTTQGLRSGGDVGYGTSPRRDYLGSMSVSPGVSSGVLRGAGVGDDSGSGGMKRVSSGLSLNSQQGTTSTSGDRSGPYAFVGGSSGMTGGVDGGGRFGAAAKDLKKAVEKLGENEAPPFSYPISGDDGLDDDGVARELALATGDQLIRVPQVSGSGGTDGFFGVDMGSPPFDIIQKNISEQRVSMKVFIS